MFQTHTLTSFVTVKSDDARIYLPWLNSTWQLSYWVTYIIKGMEAFKPETANDCQKDLLKEHGSGSKGRLWQASKMLVKMYIRIQSTTVLRGNKGD